MCVLFPEASLQPSVRPSVCLLLKFRGDELNSPAALRGGTGGLLIQLLHRCVHSSNTRPPHFLNTHTTTQSRAPSTSPTAQKEKENTRKNKPKKKKTLELLSRVSSQASSSSWGATFFLGNISQWRKKKKKKRKSFYAASGRREGAVKTQLKGAAGRACGMVWQSGEREGEERNKRPRERPRA